MKLKMKLKVKIVSPDKFLILSSGVQTLYNMHMDIMIMQITNNAFKILFH